MKKEFINIVVNFNSTENSDYQIECCTPHEEGEGTELYFTKKLKSQITKEEAERLLDYLKKVV